MQLTYSFQKERNKEGKVFGFARFVGVKYVCSLEYQLKNVWFCSYKIWANVSKFSREDDESRAVKVKIKDGGKESTMEATMSSLRLMMMGNFNVR